MSTPIRGLVIVFALALAGCGSAAPSAVEREPTDIVVDFNSSSGVEKDQLLLPLIKTFNAERHKIGNRAVRVEVRQMDSGEAQAKIARREIQPTVWSPADKLWAAKLNYEARQQWASPDSPVLMRSAVVIAMWESMARALGWPDHPVGWRDVLRLASEGWASAGRPEFGPFKFVHTSPDSSTSGIAATAAEYQFAAGKQRGLRIADVTDAGVRRRVRRIERSIEHYGNTTNYPAEQLAKHRQRYASAVVLGEVTVLRFNRAHKGERLIAIYPAEGTIFREEPLVVLDAPWVSPRQKQAARMLGSYLAKRITAAYATSLDYRPADPNAELPVEDWRALGVDVTLQTATRAMPTPPVLAAIQRAWRKDRKPARVQIVVDTSSSMRGRPLRQATRGLRGFLQQIAPQDEIGLIAFSSVPRIQLRLGTRFGDSRRRLRDAIDELVGAGGTAYYDATAVALDGLSAARSRATIDAIVLLTDGVDNRSGLSYEQLLAKLRAEGRRPRHLRLFTILYGADGGDRTAAQLAALAAATGGRSYAGDELSIEAVYRDISLFF